MHCIYCCKKKEGKEFTLEHVIPQFLGGAHAPDFLKTRQVCKSCNNNLGLFVDASFEKNWMVSNWLHGASSAFYDRANPIGISLICMGSIDLCPPCLPEDHICEVWLGPQGEQIFWLRPHEERFSSYVGGNPRTMKSTETRAYFLFSENTQHDPLKTWLSFEQALHGRKVKKILCADVEGADPASIGFERPDELDLLRAEFFLESTKDGRKQEMKITVVPDFDFRFMCKLAIGVAFCLFGPKILASDFGKELGRGLWYRKGDGEPKILGSGLFASHRDQDFYRLVGFPNAVVVVLLNTPSGIAINLNISEQLNWTILCAPTEILSAEDLAKVGDGKVLLFVRALKVGAYLELPSYLACKLGSSEPPELNAVLERSQRAKT